MSGGLPASNRRRHRWRGPLAAVVAVTVLGLAGCGVPVDRSPTTLPRRGVPFGLLRPSSRSTTTSAPSPASAAIRIFLVGPSGRLAAVARQVPASQEALSAVLGALVVGPTNAEAAAGLGSAVPSQTTVLAAVVGQGGVATVNLGVNFAQLVGQAQIEAVAQIVFSATGVTGVTGVTFELAGRAVKVPVASGAQVAVATPAQFAALAPGGSTNS
ncbi:MAG TPA: GerMN domain-containing protein [Acidimicrobiales bacterium]|nr:GerMN domain-containing protein [Acidimicrobiales bacterium]